VKPQSKRAIFVWSGAGMFSAAFLVPSAVLPFAELSPMLVVVGVTAPAGIGFVLLQYVNAVATRDDVRIVRQVQPERQAREDLVG